VEKARSSTSTAEPPPIGERSAPGLGTCSATSEKPSLNLDLANSYRPISNLSFISKLVERIVAKRFTSYATTFNLFPPQQSAYRAHHSTETAVLSVRDDLVHAIDRGQESLLVLLDLSAAFDTVDHQILLMSVL
jgi:hypothetical protein